MTIRELQEVVQNGQEIRIGTFQDNEIKVNFWGTIQDAPEKFLDKNVIKIMIRKEKIIMIYDDESESTNEEQR